MADARVDFSPATGGQTVVVTSNRARAYTVDGTTEQGRGTPEPRNRAVEQVQALGGRAHGGLMASYDGFYSELFARDENGLAPRATQLLARLRDWGVHATDMETSALLAIGRYRDLRCATLCALTVEAAGHRALEGADRGRVEDTLVQAALQTLAGEPVETAATQASGRQK